MYFWGMKIDITTGLFLIVVTGLAVDYATHIAHSFMVTNLPSRNERIKRTLLEMGPPVFKGGFSTFLAFALLGFSKTPIFVAVFRVFILLVLFGMYNGLVLLPVVLSLIGPKAVVTDNNSYMKLDNNIQ